MPQPALIPVERPSPGCAPVEQSVTALEERERRWLLDDLDDALEELEHYHDSIVRYARGDEAIAGEGHQAQAVDDLNDEYRKAFNVVHQLRELLEATS